MLEEILSELKEYRKNIFDVLDMCRTPEENRACLDTIHYLTKAIECTDGARVNFKKLVSIHHGEIIQKKLSNFYPGCAEDGMQV